ncbi:MAG: hypothetical protein MUQ04_03045, partial [Paracoccaceae bacterium]|nr:hypothetical protein [Paracoccaceae bacterium]
MTSPSPKKPLQVKLDMYLAPPSEPGFRAMTDCLCHDLGACARLAPDRDPAELAQNGQLILGHICAITFARAKTGLYHYLGALSPRAPETPQGHYRRGVGETPIVPPLGAVSNAVSRAIGKRLT